MADSVLQTADDRKYKKSIYDTLRNLVLEKAKNKVVDYQHNELSHLAKKKE